MVRHSFRKRTSGSASKLSAIKMRLSMVMAALRYSSNSALFCASAAEVYAGSTANGLELQK